MHQPVAITVILLSAVTLGAGTPPTLPTLPDRMAVPDHHRMEGAAKRAALEVAPRPAGPAKDWVLDERPSTIDVSHYSLDLHFNPDRRLLGGHVRLSLSPVVDQLTEVVLDADQGLRILGVTQVADLSYPHDSACTLDFSHRDHLLTIELPRPLARGEEIELLVAYGGTAGRDGYGVGWGRSMSGAPLITTFSQPYGARSWWPCNDRPDDKATVDVRVTVDDRLSVASNGLEISRSANADGSATTAFASRYPVATYLVVVNITDYVYLSHPYQSLDGSVTMPVEVWSYPHLADESASYFANTPQIITVFAERFGEYPFLEEKYGNAHTPFGGGMEHQTLCSYGSSVMGLVWLNAHETAHQWWGDTVTYDSWQEIWLAEGLASYSEWLWIEATDPAQMMPYGIGSDGMGYFLGPLYDNPVLFSVTVYDKAAWVYHMLRWVVGDDNFFAGLQLYHQRHSMGVASTDDLVNAMESVSGQELGWFFEQWVYGENRPHYQYSWEGVDSTSVTLTVRQVHENAGLFRMPVEVELTTGAGAERSVVWLEAEAEQTIEIPVNGFPVTDLVLDPDHWLLADIGPAADPDLELGTDYPGPIDFGTVLLGESSRRTIAMRNVGGAPLEIEDIFAYYGSGFSVESPATLPVSIAPGESLDLVLNYRSSGYNVASDYLLFVTNDPSRGNLTIMPMVGTGAASEAPMVILAPSLNFGRAPVGGLVERSFDVRNFGAQDLNLELELPAGDFSLGSPLTATLATRERSEVRVLFSPSAVGEQELELIMHTNDPLHEEVVVPLRGEGLAAPRLALEPTTLNFGLVEGQAGLTLDIANTGDEELVVSQLAVEAPFNLPTDEALPLTIAAGSSHQVELRFEGSGATEVRGALYLHSNDPVLPVAVVPLYARPIGASASSSWAVAAVARTPGIGGAYWQSSASFLNVGGETLAVDVDFAPSGSSADGAKDLALSVPAGAMRSIDDVLDAAALEGVGGLLVDTLPHDLLMVTRTFTTDAVGSYGQYIPAVAIDDALTGATESVLAGLAGNGGFHTNFGILNLGDAPLTVHLELYAADGSRLGALDLDAPAAGFAQLTSIVARVTGNAVRGGFAVLTSDDPAARYLAYGSVVDDASHDPTFVAPQVASTAPLDAIIPAVAANPGLNDTLWSSELTLVNRGETDASVELSFHPRGAGPVATASVNVAPHAALYLADVVGDTLGREGSGWLGLSSANAGLVVMSRTFNSSDAGTFGQLVQAVDRSALFAAGDIAVLPGLRSTDGFRANVGVASASDTAITVTLTAFAADGSALGSLPITVPARSLVQVERVLADRFSFSGEAWATLTSDDPDAAYTAYLSMVDGGTGDPIFVPAMAVTAAR